MWVFRNFTVAASVLLAVAGSAMAQPAAPAPVAPAPAASDESVTVSENRIMCVHQDAPTGSRLGAKKICHTNAQWRTIHANAEQDMLYMQDRINNGMEGAALAAGH
jgi:hypothetical protein